MLSPHKINRARKMIAIWGETAERLKAISEATGLTQVELVHVAVHYLARKYGIEPPPPEEQP